VALEFCGLYPSVGLSETLVAITPAVSTILTKFKIFT
jgi:hypothetical protein